MTRKLKGIKVNQRTVSIITVINALRKHGSATRCVNMKSALLESLCVVTVDETETDRWKG